MSWDPYEGIFLPDTCFWWYTYGQNQKIENFAIKSDENEFISIKLQMSKGWIIPIYHISLRRKASAAKGCGNKKYYWNTV